MTLKKLQFRGGTSAQNDAFTGAEGEITVDTTNHRMRVHDGATEGGKPIAREDELPTALADLTNDAYHSKTSLTKLSQLTSNASDYWTTAGLTKVSQLTNDAGYVSGHCTHCTHCSYCTDCS